jgi:hypothetical protein
MPKEGDEGIEIETFQVCYIKISMIGMRIDILL